MATVPGFSRVEIRTRGKDDLLLAAVHLKKLAGDLEMIAGQRQHNDEEATILAHHKIKAVSQTLRGTGG